MPNITMTIDEDLLKKAKRMAVEKNTSLTAMIRSFLEKMAERQDLKKEQAILKLKSFFNDKKVKIGGKKWSRDDLYER